MKAMDLYRRACQVYVNLPVGENWRLRRNAEVRLRKATSRMVARYENSNGIVYANRLMLEISIDVCKSEI